jgi:hypothetical protein
MIEKDVEDALVRIVNMNLKLGQRSGVVQHGHTGRDDSAMPGMVCFVKGGAGGKDHVLATLGAIERMQYAVFNSGGSLGNASEPCSSDMIPAMQGLYQVVLSQESVSDMSMETIDSVLGKLMIGETEMGDVLDLSLALTCHVPARAKERGKKVCGVGVQ